MRPLALYVIGLFFTCAGVMATSPVLVVGLDQSQYELYDYATVSINYSDVENDLPGDTIIFWYKSASVSGASPEIIGSYTETINITSDIVGFYISAGVVIRQQDGLEESEETFSDWVYVYNYPPSTNADSYSGFLEGQSYSPFSSVLDNDNDYEGHTLTASVVTLPAYGVLSFNPDGTFTYTHDGSNTLTDGFTYQALDPFSVSATTSVTLYITQVNDPPVAADDNYSGVTQGQTLSVSAPGVLENDTDEEGLALSAVKVTDPLYGTLTLNANGSFVYVHNGSLNLFDSFRYYATDGDENSPPVTVTITLTAANVPPVVLDDLYSGLSDEGELFTVNASLGVLENDYDDDADGLTVQLITDVKYGELSLATDGSFTYMHDGSENHTDTFTYQAFDGTDFSTIGEAIIIVNAVNDAPIGYPDTYDNISEGETYVVSAPGVLANDIDPDNISLSASLVNNAQHGTVTLQSDGGFTYEHDGSENFSDSFTYTVSDGIYTSEAITVSLSLLLINEAPIAQNDLYDELISEGGLLQVPSPGILSNDLDPEGDALQIIQVSNVANGTLSLNQNGSFTYQHNGTENYTDSFVYRLYDGEFYSSLTTVTINVAPVNDAPVAIADSYSGISEGEGRIVAAPGVLSNDTDAEGSLLTASLVTNVSHGSLTLNNNGAFTYTHDDSENFTDQFTYRVYDGTTYSTAATVTLTITPVNEAPNTTSDLYGPINEGAILSIGTPGVLDNDADPEGTSLTAVLVATTTHGTLTFSANGSFLYAHDGGESASDVFTYRASDGVNLSTITTATIQIDLANDIPVASPDTYTNALQEGGTLNVAAPGVLGNDSDADPSDVLEASLVQNVQQGTLTLNKNGSFTYIHNGSENLSDYFVYRAYDGQAYSSNVNVSITAIAVNDAPVGVNDTYSGVAEGATLNVSSALGVLVNDTDAEGDALIARLRSNPQHGVVTLNNNGSFTYIHNGTENFNDAFSYRAYDASDSSALITVGITIMPVNDAPAFVYSPVTSASEGIPYTYNIVLSDAENNTLTLVADSKPNWLSLQKVDNTHYTLSGTPAVANVGDAPVLLTLSDGVIATPISQSFVITVTFLNDPPVFTSAPITTANEDAEYSYTIKAQDPDHAVLSFRAEFNANWLDFDPAVSNTSARLFGTPLQANVGVSVPVKVYVSDGVEEISQEFSVSVVNVNDVPRFTSTPITLSQEDVLYNYLITTADEDGDNMVITAVQKPSFLSFQTITNGSARLVGTPGNEHVGVHPVTISVTDNKSTAVVQSFSITVEQVNDRPIANADAYQIVEGGLLAISALNGVLQNDIDAENDVLAAFTVTSPSYSSAFSFNPNGGFTYQHNGQNVASDQFSYKATDGTDTSLVATVQITVSLVNDRPVAKNDAYSVSEGAILTVDAASGILKNDTDEETPASLEVKSVLTQTLYGTLQLTPKTGAFIYTHDGSETTTDFFDYILKDAGGAVDTARVTISILPTNDAPVLSSISTVAVEFTEGGTAKLVASQAIINDIDDEQLINARIQFTNNYISGEDSLFLNGTFTGINVSFDQATGTLNLTGAAQLSAYQSALQNVRYINTNQKNPSALTRTLTIVVSDGKALSNVVSKPVAVIPVNDPPSVSSLIISSNGRIATRVNSNYQYVDPEGDSEGKGIYQWYQSETAAGTGKTLITGADTTFYTPVFANGGRFLQFELTPADNKNALGVRIASNYLYINAAPEARNLTINGIRAVNETLLATFDYFDTEGDLAGVHTYQWYRSDTGTAFLPTAIVGATSSTYIVKNKDKDKLLAVDVTPVAVSGSLNGRTTRSGWTIISLLPSVSISDSITICNDSIGELTIAHTGTYPIYFTYAINGVLQVDTVRIDNEDELSISVSDTGTYQIMKVWDTAFPKGIQSGVGRVSYFADPSLNLSGTIPICDNDTSTFYIPIQISGGLAPYTIDYRIDGLPGGTLTDVRSIDSIPVKIANAGVYTVNKIIDSRGCYSPASGQSVVLEKQTPRAIISGIDTICEGDSALITVQLVSGTGPWEFSYLWEGEAKEVEVTTPGITSYKLYEKRDGNYKLQSVSTISDGKGCVSGAATISKYSQPLGFISGNYRICSDQDTVLNIGLSGTAPWTFTYAVNGVNKDTIRGVNSSVYRLRVNDEGKYTLRRLSDAHCPGRTSDTAYIDTILLPDVRILNLNDVYTIQDQEIILNGTPEGGIFNGNGAFVFKTFEGDWFFYPEHTSPSIDVPYNITYNYSKPGSGCSSADTAKVFVVSNVGDIFILNANDTICVSSDTILLRGVNSDPSPEPGQFRIEGDKGLITLNNDTALIIPSEIVDKPGFYKRRVYYTFDLGGADETVYKDIYFQKLQADFNWYNECFNDSSKVKFKDQTIGNENISEYSWRFHLPDSTYEIKDTNQVYFTFRKFQDYPVEHIVTSKIGCVDTVMKTLQLKQAIRLDTETYSETFENGQSGWKIGSMNDSESLWNLGLPEGSIIGPPTVGNKTWYTHINDHSEVAQSYLTSPCFSFQNYPTPFVKFKMWRAFEMNDLIANDGAVLQYTSNGETWTNVGAIGDGIEWYNWYDIASQPGHQPVGWYKTRDSKWVEARHSLDALAGKKTVQFRFVYATTGDEISNEGLAIDDFAIGLRSKTILFEHFTNINDTNSMKANATLNLIANEFRNDIIDIQYHTSVPSGDPFYATNPIAINARETFYGITKVPYTIIDGGRNNKPSLYYDHIDRKMVREDIIKSFLVDNNFDIDVSLNEANNNLSIDVTLSARKDIAKRLLNLYLVVTERSVTDYTSIHGEDEFEGVFVTMLPSPEGTSFNMSWSKGDSEQVNFNWKIQRVHNSEEVRIVAFLQDPATKEVLQAGYADLVPLVNSDDIKLQGTDEALFVLTPNPVTDKAFVRFNNRLECKGVWKIYASTGQVVENYLVGGNKSLMLNFEGYRSGIYIIQLVTDNKQIQTQKFIVIE